MEKAIHETKSGIEIRCAQIVGRVLISRKQILPTPVVAISDNLFVGQGNVKLLNVCPTFLGEQIGSTWRLAHVECKLADCLILQGCPHMLIDITDNKGPNISEPRTEIAWQTYKRHGSNNSLQHISYMGAKVKLGSESSTGAGAAGTGGWKS